MQLSEEPRLYTDLATWWPLFSPLVHYVDEAADLLPTLLSATNPPPRTLLELGSGGGSLASHFKRHLQLTLTDRSAGMLEVSRRVNPECEHVLGDMRSLDLGRRFDLVFIHDSIMYATDRASVRAAITTAARHCRPEGAVVIVPDFVKETFEPSTGQGGEDAADGRGLRYLEWTWDPDPSDDTCDVAFSFLLRDANGTVTLDGDHHRCGIFDRALWMEWIQSAGFQASSRTDPWNRDVFVGRKSIP
jgi:Methyltransferase domain